VGCKEVVMPVRVEWIDNEHMGRGGVAFSRVVIDALSQSLDPL